MTRDAWAWSRGWLVATAIAAAGAGLATGSPRRALLFALPALACAAWSLRDPARALLVGGMFGLAYFAAGVMEAFAAEAPALRAWSAATALAAALAIGAYGKGGLARRRSRR